MFGVSLLVVLLCPLIFSSISFANTSGQPKGDSRLTSASLDFRQASLGQRPGLGARFVEQESQATCGPCIEPTSKDRPIKFFRSRKTWAGARRACVMNGGHLAIIRSVEDELAVRNVLERENVTEAWLGFHSKFERNEWLSVLDEQLDSFCYVHWRGDEPNVVQTSNTCVSYLNPGMQNQNCDGLLSYFCEYTGCPGSA